MRMETERLACEEGFVAAENSGNQTVQEPNDEEGEEEEKMEVD